MTRMSHSPLGEPEPVPPHPLSPPHRGPLRDGRDPDEPAPALTRTTHPRHEGGWPRSESGEVRAAAF